MLLKVICIASNGRHPIVRDELRKCASIPSPLLCVVCNTKSAPSFWFVAHTEKRLDKASFKVNLPSCLMLWPSLLSLLSSLVCRYYDAVIDMLSEDGETCTVTFDGYGTTVIVKVMYPHQSEFRGYTVELLVSFSCFSTSCFWSIGGEGLGMRLEVIQIMLIWVWQEGRGVHASVWLEKGPYYRRDLTV